MQGDDGNKKRVGTANGIATSMQMLGIGICNIIVGAMYDANKQGPDTPPDAKGWEPIMLFFAAMSVGAFACAVLLKVRRTVNRLFIGVNRLSCAVLLKVRRTVNRLFIGVNRLSCAVLLKVRRIVNRLFIGVNRFACAPQGAKNGCEEWVRRMGERGTERNREEQREDLKWVGG